mgnify:CR=1 FL=1
MGSDRHYAEEAPALEQPYLDLLYPIPTGHDFGDGTAEFAYAPTQPTDENLFVGKIDWNANPDDNFLVRVSSDRSNFLSIRAPSRVRTS